MTTRSPRHGLARILSKRGICSRSEAARLIVAGRVSVRGRIVRDPEHATAPDEMHIDVDGRAISAPQRRYLMLNKPRGLVTTTRDERSRETVYRCFDDAPMGWIAPVGRLDKASEGLLLFSNDPQWAARITDPVHRLIKTYHVQVAGILDAELLQRMQSGVEVDGELLAVARVHLLRAGERNAWLEIGLDEGRNRQIRRILSALDIEVLRLVRVTIGPLALGDLAKGAWRYLTSDEVSALGGAG